MKQLFIFFSFLVFTLTGSSLMAQGAPDSDGDGIPDSEDVCPMIKGTAANKGCPPAEKAQAPAAKTVFMKKEAFEDILNAVCNNSFPQKVNGAIKYKKVYETTFPKNGPRNEFPVYFEQTRKNLFVATMVLSNSVADLEKITSHINELLAGSRACNNAFREAQLSWTPAAKTYSDVLAYDWGGIFFSLGSKKEKNTSRVQLTITKLEYDEAKKPAPPVPVVNECAEMETIMDACVQGLEQLKGSLEKTETPSKYYSTTLPGLGLAKKHIVETIHLDFSEEKFDRKKVVYFNTEKQYTNADEAVAVYRKLKATLKKCFSGTASESDSDTQKIYEFFIEYKGQTIRACPVFLNFLGNITVSINFRKT